MDLKGKKLILGSHSPSCYLVWTWNSQSIRETPSRRFFQLTYPIVTYRP